MTEQLTAIRPAVAEDFEEIMSLAGYATRTDVVVLVAERGGSIRCAGVVDPAGCATEPLDPVIRIVDRADDADLAGDLHPLVDALADAAASLGAPRVVIGWDPMDAQGLRMLDTAGFRPTGANPYFELGPDQVEYVTGYRDPTGSTVDLARELG
jgi:hypothetical protein